MRRCAKSSDGITHELDRRPIVADLPDEMGQNNQQGQRPAAPQVQSGAELAVYLRHDVLAVRREVQGHAEPQAKEAHG